MADVETLIRRIQVRLPGAPDPLITEEYVEAVREFCRETRVWRLHAPFLVRMWGGEYLVDAELAADVFDALFVEVDGRRLAKRTQEQSARQLGNGTRPEHYRFRAGRLVITAPPDEGTVVTGAFIAQPARGATVIDDALLERLEEHFEHGALARLLLYPGQPWTSGELASYHHQRFQGAIDTWRALAVDEGMVGVARRIRYGGY